MYELTNILNLLNNSLVSEAEAKTMLHDAQQMSDSYYMLSKDMFTNEWVLV